MLNFFTCGECADNFRTETEDYIKHLSKPYDAIQYMWTVHNSVNKRLEKDESTDPYHPKIMFPSKSQCPKCYSNTTDEHEPVWVETEVTAFLITFYSRSRIEGIKELDKLNNKIDKKYVSVSSAKNSQKKRDIPILFDNFDSRVDSKQKITQADLSSKVFSVLTIASVFFILLYVYFSFVKKKSKLKKHII